MLYISLDFSFFPLIFPPFLGIDHLENVSMRYQYPKVLGYRVLGIGIDPALLKRKRTLNLNLFNHSSSKMAAPYSFVVRDDNTRKTYDARVENKFKWEWLTEKDTHGDFLSSGIRKIDADGLAWLFMSKRSELQQ